jgi:HEAT repeat protein
MFGNNLGAVEKAVQKKNTATLMKLADSNDVAVKLAAIAGMGAVGGQDITNYLITRLQSDAPETRLAVVQSLGAIGDMHTKAFLSEQMKRKKCRKFATPSRKP